MSEQNNAIITRLKGGLGNQLFQYAVARALSIDSNRPLLVDVGWFHRKSRPQHYRLNEFKANPGTIAYDRKTLNGLKFASRLRLSGFLKLPSVVDEPAHLGYTPLKVPGNAPALLEGYWQTAKYFEHHRQTLLSDLTTSDAINTSSLKKFDDNTVAVHIRRGDYIRSGHAHVVSESYIRNAMNAFGNNANFLFFSDDVNWCQDRFGNDNVDFSDQPSDLMDLLQMSYCNHNIIANSSFSWWSAWLNTNEQQRVIAPSPWSESGKTHADILLDHWERIPI